MTPAALEPRLGALALEAFATAWRSRVSTGLLAVLVAAMCATTLATVGRADAAEQQVATRMDSAGARELQIADSSETWLTPTVVQQVAGLSVVERTVGIGRTFDVTNAVLGPAAETVPASVVTSGMSAAIRLVEGRMPQAGEGIVTFDAMRRLGFEAPFGAVEDGDGRVVSIVGAYEPVTPFERFTGVLVSAPHTTARELVAIAASADVAGDAQTSALRLISPADPMALQVVSPATLAEVRAEVVGDLASFGQTLLLLVLGAGAFLVAAVVWADSLMRRVDLGRRRALGATRWALGVLVVGRTAIAAMTGAIVGVTASLIVLHALGFGVSGRFAAATAILTVVAAVAGSIPPAAVAAFQDPLRVLRTP